MKRYDLDQASEHDQATMVESADGQCTDAEEALKRDKRIAELEQDAALMAMALHQVAKEERRCRMCLSAPHVGTGHASWCRVGKHLKADAPEDGGR